MRWGSSLSHLCRFAACSITEGLDVKPFPPSVSMEASLLRASGETQRLLSVIVVSSSASSTVNSHEDYSVELSSVVKSDDLENSKSGSPDHSAASPRLTPPERGAPPKPAESMLHLAAEMQNREKLHAGDFQT